jgi:NACHT domain
MSRLGQAGSNSSCLADLRSTDPRDDKLRIERTKGGLLKDAYKWILGHADFQRWREDKESRLLWIKGDPGKGKTMLLIGIIQELKQQGKESKKEAHMLSYFFCQGTDSRLNNATAVLRGLIYLLLDQEPSLMSYVRKKYDSAGKALFEDVNAFDALSTIFTNMLHDLKLKGAYLVIDALDECEMDLPQLLELIKNTVSTYPHVKWIVSSRNKPEIEARLRLESQMKFSLELNAVHVSQAVKIFIDYKVAQLASVEHDSALQEEVRSQIHKKANGTFLWVALVFQELEQVDSWDMRQVLKEMPPDLPQLYDRMMVQVQQLKRKDPKFCRLVLATMTLAYRPLHLLELGVLSDLPGPIANNMDGISKIVGKCGSFLTIQEDTIYFIHQSAKDYLDSSASKVIFPSGRGQVHYSLYSKSLEVMFEKLKCDIYELCDPGISIELVKPSDPDLLSPLRYSCVYWASHFDEVYRGNTLYQSDLENDGNIHLFIKKCLLYWLEALSLIKSMSSSVQTINILLTLLKVSLDYYYTIM